MRRFICIHGHFYQPPRENPWLGEIERQESAAPYHDWNQRINAECYAANACSRILDDAGRTVRIVNNYSRISFNFGPTLLVWLERHAPETYQAILDADRDSVQRFGGHGSAMAQVYGHPILPLCNDRDRRTQVLWGIRDFTHRFGREPEGMWLPETAVDLESLEQLAAAGIRFTVLAPWQAGRVRKRGNAEWTTVTGVTLDTRRPYRVELPSGRQIAVFFYDGPAAGAVAFAGLLDRGEHLAARLLEPFDDETAESQLVHIATDGETYGHHHRHGEMALAWALDEIESRQTARLTNYAEYLALHPPDHEATIVEDSAWSCTHELGRWTRDCGCRLDSDAGGNQIWRAPLREALDVLRDRMTPLYEEGCGQLLGDPWLARDEYVELILDGSVETASQFLSRHASAPLDQSGHDSALEWLELQRYLLLTQTSCAWFFDELSGIETQQILQYALRVLELARSLTGENHEQAFLACLERARSNIPELGNGRDLFESKIRPAARSIRGSR